MLSQIFSISMCLVCLTMSKWKICPTIIMVFFQLYRYSKSFVKNVSNWHFCPTIPYLWAMFTQEEQLSAVTDARTGRKLVALASPPRGRPAPGNVIVDCVCVHSHVWLNYSWQFEKLKSFPQEQTDRFVYSWWYRNRTKFSGYSDREQ